MNPLVEPVREALTEWLDDSEASMRSLRSSLDADEFCDNYLGVLAAGKSDAAGMAERLVKLVDDTLAQRVSVTAFLESYIDVMSVPYRGGRTFLPSFTDSCLSSLHPQSPFRGLNTCWMVGEAYYALRRGDAREAHDKLQELDRQLRRLPHRATTGLQRTGHDLDGDIIQIKEMIRDVVTRRKWAWTASFPYPCRTSAHFYLSGIRFYWSPVVERTWLSGPGRGRLFRDTDRFSVQSTSSGLFSPSERYGYLIPAHGTTRRRAEVAARLLGEVPVGSLALDLMDGAPTPADRRAARYYERWSVLVAQATLPIVQQTLADCVTILAASPRDQVRLREHARQAFDARASKNPMRTIYFDCGLIAAARRHCLDTSGTPHVQYVTTQASDPHNDPLGLGVEMFRKVRSLCGDGLRVYAQPGERFANPDLPVWTLVPIGQGLRTARTTWSSRSSMTTPILHGFEGRATPYLLQAIRKWGYDIRQHAGVDALVVALASETYARGDIGKEAITAGTALLFLCAAQSVIQPARRVRNVRNELQGVPTSGRYMRITAARDWTQLA